MSLGVTPRDCIVSHPVAGVISDSNDLSSYCVFDLAPFDVFVLPIYKVANV